MSLAVSWMWILFS